MKTMADRKLIWVGVGLDDIVSILHRHGYLNSLSLDGNAFNLPDDARVVGSELAARETAGAAQLRIALESDQLGEAFRFAGHATILPAESPS
ncbi:MAG TPA: hypothetical protein VMG10_30940 [Gemmataceae bacterium]|nr:hypothetical protein [Gemmataceae bacterium]